VKGENVDILVILFSIIIISSILLCYNVCIERYKKKLLKQIKNAIDEFGRLCVPSRLFSDAEKEQFLLKYKLLYQRIGKYFRKTSYQPIQIFNDYYENIDTYREKTNQEYCLIQILNDQVPSVYEKLVEFLQTNSYIARHDWFEFRETIAEIFNSAIQKWDFTTSICEQLKQDVNMFVYTIYSIDSEIRGEEYVNASLLETLNISRTILADHNKAFVQREKETHKDYFDKLFAYPLDEQQRESVVTQEDNVLVISAAGSGKTSTIVAKAHYLIEKCGVHPSELLAVSFTHKSAEELGERIGYSEITCATFHKHALDTIGNITGQKPAICDPDRIRGIFETIFQTNQQFQSDFLTFESIGQLLLKYDYEYTSAEDHTADLKKYGSTSPYRDMNGCVMKMRSMQEIELSIILTELGIDFVYEEKYPYNTADAKHRQYYPDFTIYYNKRVKDQDGNVVLKKCRLYLEHFGIDKYGRVPSWFGDGKTGGWEQANRNYQEGIRWKKLVHAENQTDLIYTTSADFQDHSVATKLYTLLQERGVPMKKLTNEEKIRKFYKPLGLLQDNFIKFVTSFITLMKANEKTLDDVIAQIPVDSEHYTRNVNAIRTVVEPIYKYYASTLEQRKEIDFTDALLQAAKLLEQNPNTYRYKYILVDEFQDMSMDKYKFLKSLRCKNPYTKFFCVGDDWQSIYRFSGSDMGLFTNFSQYFGYTEELRIEATHRFGNPLLNKSSRFILKNPVQKEKNLIADELRETQLDFVAIYDEVQWKTEIHDIIQKIPANESVNIIARYKHNLFSLYPELEGQDKAGRRSYELRIENHKIRCMTVHSAKGLEADHVILINCDGGIYGFPSLVEDDPLLAYLLSGEDEYEYSEERRTFYVAITRAKKRSIVLYDATNPSVFVSEFVDLFEPDELCPRCRDGQRIIHKDAISKNNRLYTVIRCSNPYCEYFETLFMDEIDQILSVKEYITSLGASETDLSRARVEYRTKNNIATYVIPTPTRKAREIAINMHPAYSSMRMEIFLQEFKDDICVTVYKNGAIKRALLNVKSKLNVLSANNIEQNTNSESNNLITLTYELIEAARTPNGGFTKSQLEAIDVSWPAPPGWIRQKVGTTITKEQFELFKTIQYVQKRKRIGFH
jgi:DNA helicase-4